MLNQLQELDKQISDLRLDVEKTADEHLETDSRPSSGACFAFTQTGLSVNSFAP